MNHSSHSQPEHTSKALSRSEKMQEQAQRLEVVGRLAGGIAHDFNNLLGVIVGYSDLLLSTVELDPKARRKIEQIQKAGQSAAALTRQLLAFSRQQFIQPVVLGVNELVQEMAGMLQRLLREDVKFAMAVESRHGIIKADPAQIQQILINLVLNAADAMPHGGELTIETEDVLVDDDIAGAFGVSAGKFVRLVVTDTGTGISEEASAHLFEPFFTTKPVGKGTGLGLAAVYGAIGQNGGFIDVESTSNAGSSFKVYLPVTEATASPRRILPLPALSGQGETVLVAEHSPTLAALIREILTEHGFSVIMAEDGQGALESCKRHPSKIDVLLSDVIMPNMNGRELMECIKGLRPETKIIFMSGYTAEVVVQQEVLKENVLFLEKPFTPGELLNKIHEALEGAEVVGQPA